MTETRWSVVLLVVAVLCSIAGAAWAQVDQTQYAVVYVEFKPADARAGRRVLEDLAAHALASGATRFDVLQQVDRPNFFALFEIWDTGDLYAAFKALPATQTVVDELTPLLDAPLDERDGALLEGSVTPRSGHAHPRQIFVITHLDIIPDFVDQARPVLDNFVSAAASHPGVQTFAMLSWTPTTNHFQLIEVFESERAFDAHVSMPDTVNFRIALQPTIGAPYDERLYRFVGR
jgi:quinol monooxygenase YgiN